MKITSIEAVRLEMPLAVPYTIAYETVSQSTNIILKIVTDMGLVGWGCAAPDVHVTNESAQDVVTNVNAVVEPVLIGQSPFHIARLMHQLKMQIATSASTLAMVDMALYDLLAQKADLPLYNVLGGYRDCIQTSITIGIAPLNETLDEVAYYRKMGFNIIKLKGGIHLEEDIEKICLLREKYGYDFLLRFDANQGYTPDQSVEFMNRTQQYQVEIFEQPTSPADEAELEAMYDDENVLIMADESMKNLKDAYGLSQDDLTHLLNIKLMKVGGILESIRINAVAKAAGMKVMVGCLDECSLGIAAGLHFALSSQNVAYADLDGHIALLNDPFSDLFHLKAGVLYPSGASGLGVSKHVI